MNTNNKVVLVTGACGDIGKSVVRTYAAQGWATALVDLNQETLEKEKQDLHLSEDMSGIFPCNITKEEEVEEACQKVLDSFQHIDALINVAGICGKYDMAEYLDYDNFRRIYEVNVFGTFLMMKHVLPIMRTQKSGAIVNFGSVSGMRGYHSEAAYGSSKWAVIGMTQNIANEYGEFGIRANSVSPGWVHTRLMEETLRDYETVSEHGCECQVRLGPMKRPAEPSEIADAVFFLTSEQASFINGVNLLVDGGKLTD